MPDYDIEGAFRAIENELLDSMIRNLKHHRAEETKEGFEWTSWQTEQLNALNKYKSKNNKVFKKRFAEINSKIEEGIRESKKLGSMDEEIVILDAIKKGFKATKQSNTMQAQFFKVNERKLDALIKATKNDMRKAETSMLRMANDQYRKVIFNAQVYANTGAGTYEQAVDMATKDFLSRGINCIEYKNGARVNIASYAAMAIRTANTRAYLQGEGEKRQEWGISTVIVNKRGNPCLKCLKWVGKVLIDDVWSGGKASDGPYPLMSTAMAQGLYHPNCKDGHTTFFEGITEEPEPLTRKDIDKSVKATKEEQKLQYAQRQADRFQRLADYSLDKNNKKGYILKKREWINFSERSLRTKSGGDFGVDWKIVKSKEYNKKFSALSDNTKANDLAIKRSRNALINRNGKNTEELYAISLTTGKDVSSILDQHIPFGIKRTKKFNDDVKRAEGRREKILLIHNHPKGFPPSITDINELLDHENAVGITVGHNGSVYYYTKPTKKITKFDRYVAIRKTKGYNDIESEEKVLEELAKHFGFTFKKL